MSAGSTIKIIQLGENAYQVSINGRTYVGNIDYMIDTVLFNEGQGQQYEIVPIAGIKNAVYKNCTHEYVEVGFTHSKMACRFCDREKETLPSQR